VNVHPFIEAEKCAGHSVKRACDLLKVSRAAFYARRSDRPSQRRREDAELTDRISQVHAASRGAYGSPRVHAALRQTGTSCGRRRIARLMREAGLTGRCRRRRVRTTVPDPHAGFRPDLLNRDFAPSTRLNTRWCGDITYIATAEGWLYLATVIDIASRRIVGWATADHLRTSLVTEALTSAWRTRKPEPGLIFHADRGCQYTSRELAGVAGRMGIRLSVGRTGVCWDNTLAESFFATLKRELVPAEGHMWAGRSAARTAIFEYVESWYNVRRLHSSLGYRSPNDYETALAA